MTNYSTYSPEWEIDRLVERIEAGESPFALSTSEIIAASLIYDRPEWRPCPYGDLSTALERLGEWRHATLNYCHEHGTKTWMGKWVLPESW